MAGNFACLLCIYSLQFVYFDTYAYIFIALDLSFSLSISTRGVGKIRFNDHTEYVETFLLYICEKIGYLPFGEWREWGEVEPDHFMYPINWGKGGGFP